MVLDGGRILAAGTVEELARQIIGEDEVRWTRDGQRFARSTNQSTRPRPAGASPRRTPCRRWADALNAGGAARWLRRGLIELRQSFSGAGLLGHLFWPAVTLVAIFFLRDRGFRACGFTLGTLALPSMLGMFVALGMLPGGPVPQRRARGRHPVACQAIPNGISGYFIGKLVKVSGTVLLPAAAAGVELGGSWRHLETIGVLGAWTVLGLIVAPIVLRRMARRESGSRVAERREQRLQRVG